MFQLVKRLFTSERQVINAIDATTEKVNTIGTTRVEVAIERLQTSCQNAENRIKERLSDATVSLENLLTFCSSVEQGIEQALASLDDVANPCWPDGIGPIPTLPSEEQETPQKARRRTKRLN